MPPAFAVRVLPRASRARVLPVLAGLFALTGLFALAAPGPARAQSDEAAWALLPDVAPSGRGIAYDSARHRLLMFGGFDEPLYRNEVWAFDLAAPAAGWRHVVTVGTPPPGRVNASAFYDPLADRLLVIGGEDRFTVRADLVWQLALAGTPTWSEITPSGTPPPARVGRAVAFDPTTSRVMVFGGYFGAATNETFVLSLQGPPAWAQVSTPDQTPSARYFAAATFDPSRARFVLFGGWGASGTQPSDAWGLTLDPWPAWTRISGGSPAVGAPTVFHDPVNDRLVFYNLSGGAPEAWAVDYATGAVSLLPAAALPAGLIGPACVPAAVGDGALLVARGPLDDVWRLPLAAAGGWTKLAESDADPGPRFSHTVVFDAPRDRLVLFGGRGNWQSRIHRETPVFGDVMTRSHDGVWRRLVPLGGGPSARHEHTAIYDPVRERMIVFGGQTGDGAAPASSEVWALSLAGTPAWTKLNPAGPGPPARWGHAAAYDAARDRMLVFGGGAGTSLYADTWALSLGPAPAWSLVAPAPPTAPPLALWPRVDAGAVVDPAGDRLIVTGGGTHDEAMRLSDQWALNLTGDPVWQPLGTGAMAPGALRGHAALYDAAGARMLAIGGGLDEERVWELSLAGAPEWREIAAGGERPRVRRDAGAALDPARAEVAVIGGRGVCDLPPHECVYTWRGLADAWSLALAAPTPTAASLVSARAFAGRVELTWDVRGESGAVLVERRSAGGAWAGLGEAWPGGDGLVRWTDGAVTPGARFGYRLVLSGGRAAGETWIEVPATARLAMAGPRPNPAFGEVAVEFTLADDAAATLEVYDVGGRRVAARDLGAIGAGRHVVRLGEGRALAAGVYLFVVRQGGATATARGVVAR